MRGVVGVVGCCWTQQSNTLVGLLGHIYAPQQSNKVRGRGLLDSAAGALR